MTSGFDLVVQTALDRLPDGVAGRFEHNAPFDYLSVIRQVSLLHNVEIPLRIILRARRNSFFRHVGYTFLRVCDVLRSAFPKVTDVGLRRACPATSL
jgi:hypothetical protein